MEDSSFGRLFGVLFSPGKTFRSIAERPTWIVPLLVLTVCLTAMSILMFRNVDFLEAARQQGQEIPPEAARAQGFIQGCSIGAAVGGPLLIALVLAAIYLVFNLFGGEIRYKTSLAVVLHAWMPIAVSCLLAIPVLLSRPSLTLEEVQSGRVLKSNLGFLAPEDASPRLVALLTSLDFFSLWSLVLIILGFHIAARVSKTTATTVAIAVWLLGVLLAVVVAGFRGPQGG